METTDWIPRLALAVAPIPPPQTRRHEPQDKSCSVVGAQLGGLLPAVGMLSLPYTAVDERFEGQGVYRRLKQAMLAELRALAAARGLPPPTGNVSEEVPGSAQYERKIGRGIAAVLPIPYLQPAVEGLKETSLALTFEPLVEPAPRFDRDDVLRIIAAVYRGLYRIARPEEHPAFQAIIKGITE